MEMDRIANSAVSAPTRSVVLEWIPQADVEDETISSSSWVKLKPRGGCELSIGIELVLCPCIITWRATLQSNWRSGEADHAIWDFLRIIWHLRIVWYFHSIAYCDGALVEGRWLAITGSLVSPHPYASRAAAVCNRPLWSVGTLVNICGTLESSYLYRNGDVAIRSAISVFE